MFKDKSGHALNFNQVVHKAKNRVKNIILEAEIYLLHLAGYIPSHTVRNICYWMAGIRMGKGSVIHMGARFYDPKNIIIGEDSIVGEGAVLDGRDKIIIHNHVDIASEVMIYNSQHNVHSEEFEAMTGSVIIEDYVFVGPRAIILPGVTVGQGAVIAAGAVVTRDVKPFSVVAGVPAEVIGERKNKNPHYVLGRARLFR